MKELVISKQRCKSCGYCIVNCPQKCITLSEDFNNAGYKYVLVDKDKCIVCGICYLVCPDGVFEVAGKEL